MKNRGLTCLSKNEINKKKQRNNGYHCTHKGRMRPATAGQAPSRPQCTVPLVRCLIPHGLLHPRGPSTCVWLRKRCRRHPGAKAQCSHPAHSRAPACMPAHFRTHPAWCRLICCCLSSGSPNNAAPAPPSECSLRGQLLTHGAHVGVRDPRPSANRANRPRAREALPLYHPSTCRPLEDPKSQSPHTYRVVPLLQLSGAFLQTVTLRCPHTSRYSSNSWRAAGVTK